MKYVPFAENVCTCMCNALPHIHKKKHISTMLPVNEAQDYDY